MRRPAATALLTVCFHASACLAGPVEPIIAINSNLREIAALQKLTIAGHIDKFTAGRYWA